MYDPGIESHLGATFSAPVQAGPGTNPASCKVDNVYRVFSGGKKRLGRAADHSPPSSAVVKKEECCTSTPPMGRTACTKPQNLYNGALYTFFFTRLKN